MVFVAITGTIPWQLGLDVWPILRWWFCRCCAVVLAHVALASLQALHCCLCRRCAGIVTNVALASLPSLHWHCPQHRKLASPNQDTVATHLCAWRCCRGHHPCLWPHCRTWHRSTVTWPQMVWRMQHWCPCRRCAGVLGRIVPASSPTLRCCSCRRCAGIIALIAWALLPLLCWHCCPRCLCVTASIANWHLPSHKAVATRAGIIASITPLLLPALRWHCCPCCAGVFAPVMLTLPPLAHQHCRQHHKLASAQS